MDVLDEVFRTEWSRLVAVLVRDFGDLELAEDCAQDAFVQAKQKWGSSNGVPDNPGAWLTTTARRKALDTIRRSSSYKEVLRHRLAAVLHVIYLELLHRVGDDVAAAASYQRALERAPSDAERQFLERRLAALGS